MGFFSTLFGTGNTPKQTGNYRLMSSRGERHIRMDDTMTVSKTVMGTANGPYQEQIEFLTAAEQDLRSLEQAITEAFRDLFEESEEPFDVKTWSDRFNLIDIMAENTSSEEPLWMLCFEDQLEPFHHFNLHMKGRRPAGFSIDT